MKRFLSIAMIAGLSGALTLGALSAQKAPGGKTKDSKGPMSAKTFEGLSLRCIGPALMSGRVSDIAVDPHDRARYFVAAASGGVWRTVNDGTTWTPVFGKEGSYSIGCVTIDPDNPHVIWVGTGENNSQRSVGYGDGVYKSEDDGRTWKNMGLKDSQHIARILVDPKDSDVVYVAAQGPLWNAGGQRGLYKTTDGGKTWKAVLTVDKVTGVTDVAMDPRNPDVLYAAAYQRQRHVWGLVDGGPGSGIYKTTDGGKHWTKLETGLPKVDMGRIGLAVSPANPDVVYAIVEAADEKGGFFRSTNRGASWTKRGDYMTSSPQYFNEIICDPKDVNRVYAMDTWMHVTDDGGKTFHRVGEHWKHVDNHALYVDPHDTRYLLAGCDGGVYETYDRGRTWHFKANLPITQFYRVAVDNARPFFHVYGGTQDNNTLGGPSQTVSSSGIVNADWYVTVGGDGFWSQVDPKDPNIVYSEAQYGGLVRFDKRSGQMMDIQPKEGKDEAPLRWNWNAPLIISPFSHTTLYFGADKLFESKDMGNSWKAISPDLSRGLNRNKLKIMGRVWGVDAVAKNDSTSFYGTIVSLSASPLKEGLVYAGTDDGLIQVTQDDGAHWRKIDRFPGVPELSYVSALAASREDPDTVYAAFDNHKMGDFKPYLLESTDLGRTWTSIAGDLPKKGTVYSFIQDPKDAKLLFAGTEYGVFFTIDGGKHWVQLKGGMPTVAVRDMAIQARDNDLVLATFGRGFYILDDYSPLRDLTPSLLQEKGALFPVRKAWMFIPSTPLGLPGKSSEGDSYYTAPNPPFGAVFTYYLKDSLETLKEKRQKEEKKIEKKGGDNAYPPWSELRKESEEQGPSVVLIVRNEQGDVIRRVEGPVAQGIHRVAWDLRYPPANPTEIHENGEFNPWEPKPTGPMVAPGTYTVALYVRHDGSLTPLGTKQIFKTAPLGTATLPAEDKAALAAFERKTQRLQRAVLGSVKLSHEIRERLAYIEKALENTPHPDEDMLRQARAIDLELTNIDRTLSGDRVIASHNEPVPPSIAGRVQGIVYGEWSCTSAPTQTQRDQYRIAAQEFQPVLQQLTDLYTVKLKKLEDAMSAAGAPWTPGRVPVWKPE